MGIRIQTSNEASSFTPARPLVLQRKCACGGTPGPSGECESCRKIRLQRKLAIGAANDPLEQEADRIADEVLAAPPHSAVIGAPLRIQRFTAQASATAGTAPANVDRALASSGRPLEPRLRQDMEQRFGHDFSQVRVHLGPAAEQSARDVNAYAYTAGHSVVFGTGQFAPGTNEGRRLLAHELTHVIQQGQSERRQNGVSTGRAERSLQRDEDPKTIEKGTEKLTTPALEEANKAVLSAVAEIESNWKDIRDAAAGFGDAGGWLGKGDTVVELLREHTDLALSASTAGDSALTSFLTSLVESDMVMYRFIAWHVAVLVNLLSLEPQLRDLAAAFAADKRAFTGRAQAEEGVGLLTKLANAYRHESPKWLQLAKILPAEVTGSGGRKITLTVTIASHSDKAISGLFITETEKFVQDQAALGTLVEATNQFLDTAFKEGLVQTVEALVEYYQVRGSGRGGPKGNKARGRESKNKQKTDEKKEPQKKGNEKKRGRWGCTDVRHHVYPDPQANPPNPNCPKWVIGNTAYIYPSFAAACLAAKTDANNQVPRGCIKRHGNCTTKCSQK